MATLFRTQVSSVSCGSSARNAWEISRVGEPKVKARAGSGVDLVVSEGFQIEAFGSDHPGRKHERPACFAVSDIRSCRGARHLAARISCRGFGSRRHGARFRCADAGTNYDCGFFGEFAALWPQHASHWSPAAPRAECQWAHGA